MWIPIMLVFVGGLGAAHTAGLTKPLIIKARQLVGPHTPGWRLVGNWESDNDSMFRRVCHVRSKEGAGGMGIYMADEGRSMRQVLFRITSEDRSGRHVTLDEFLPEKDINYRVRYTIAGDGKSMTREYDTRTGRHVSCQYRYIGPPPQEAPWASEPKP